MDRREAIKALGGAEALATFTDVLKAEGISVQTVSEKTAENAVLMVLRHPGVIGKQAAQSFRESWQKCFIGTSLEHVRMVIIEEGMTLEVVTLPPAKRTKWRIVDQMIEEHGDGEE